MVYKPTLPAANYTIRLFFAEPEDLAPGQRVFDVEVQGKRVLKGFDIVKAAGGVRRGVIKEYKHVLVKDQLSIRLARAERSMQDSILCGVEMILEETVAAGRTPAAK